MRVKRCKRFYAAVVDPVYPEDRQLVEKLRGLLRRHIGIEPGGSKRKALLHSQDIKSNAYIRDQA